MLYFVCTYVYLTCMYMCAYVPKPTYIVLLHLLFNLRKMTQSCREQHWNRCTDCCGSMLSGSSVQTMSEHTGQFSSMQLSVDLTYVRIYS